MILWHVYRIVIKRSGAGFTALSKNRDDIEDVYFPLAEWLDINQKLAEDSVVEEVGRFGKKEDADFTAEQLEEYKSFNHRFGSDLVYYIVLECHISQVKTKIWDFVNIALQCEG